MSAPSSPKIQGEEYSIGRAAMKKIARSYTAIGVGGARLLRQRSTGSESPPGSPRHRTATMDSLDRLFDTGHEGGEVLPRKEAPADEKKALDSYGLAELRDSFFDASFCPPEHLNVEELMEQAALTLPHAFRKPDPFSITKFLPETWYHVKGVLYKVVYTRAGIKLLKAFLGFFIAYVLCLVPVVRAWLGPHSYVMVISTIINHSGRPVGSQVEGAIVTILGTASGLGWGAFGLWLSTVTPTARVGYGGILAAFMFLYMFVLACIRSYYIRTYQLVICAGIAVSYTCLAEVSSDRVTWSKLLQFGIPFALGQAISLLACILVVPEAGARPLAVALHSAFDVMVDGLTKSRKDQATRRKLAQTFINLSQAYRDLVLDFSITLFEPKDVFQLRNRMQSVIRGLLSLKSETELFDGFEKAMQANTAAENHVSERDFVINIEAQYSSRISAQELQLLKFVAENLVEPTEWLLVAMKVMLQSCDAVLMEMCGHRKYLGPPLNIPKDVAGSLTSLRKRVMDFGAAQDKVLASNKLPAVYSDYPEVIKLFTFCRHVHQAATAIEALAVTVNEMEQRKPKFPRFRLPAYPFWKSLHRTNAQVRHDRGGLTAGAYFRSFNDIGELIHQIASKEYRPLAHRGNPGEAELEKVDSNLIANDLEDEDQTKLARVGHSIWSVLHRLQGFETRFGIKTAAVTSLLSIPAWLPQSSQWWNDYEIWWAVAIAWLVMAPRVGGNIQDLASRVICGVAGAVWGGLSYFAGNGNPFVTAAFAIVFMVPMMYRFIQSSHTRSGFIGCISFTVVSLAEHSAIEQSVLIVAVSRGVAIITGVAASIVVNWVIWPFVARHDLRKATSMMLFYCSIVYRNIVSKYVYFDQGQEPTEEDVRDSEILESRLREGFVRLRQLMGLTRHELRLRSPYDPLPFSGLIDACERFFENIVAVRQASLFYHPLFVRDNPEAAARLLGPRRDAIAAILTNLYTLSGALKAGRKLPKLLPDAAAARHELLSQSAALETELINNSDDKATEKTDSEKWAQIYSYSYSESLTGCVAHLKELERYTKLIVGEQAFETGLNDETWEMP